MALRLRPDIAEAHTNLGVALARQGRVSEAIVHYSESLRIRPDIAEAHNNLGNALARQGRVSEAIVHYSEALRLKPDYTEAHYNLGVALANQRKVEKAIHEFMEVLRIAPGNQMARRALDDRAGAHVRAAAHHQGLSAQRPNQAENGAGLPAPFSFSSAADQAR